MIIICLSTSKTRFPISVSSSPSNPPFSPRMTVLTTVLREPKRTRECAEPSCVIRASSSAETWDHSKSTVMGLYPKKMVNNVAMATDTTWKAVI